jgi:hypothetical protein
MYLPKEFVLAEATRCGELIDQTYNQYKLALEPTNPAWALKGAWRVFNTEDLVPTLPFSTLEGSPESVLGLFESKIELLLKLVLKETPFLFQHVNSRHLSAQYNSRQPQPHIFISIPSQACCEYGCLDD